MWADARPLRSRTHSERTRIVPFAKGFTFLGKLSCVAGLDPICSSSWHGEALGGCATSTLLWLNRTGRLSGVIEVILVSTEAKMRANSIAQRFRSRATPRQTMRTLVPLSRHHPLFMGNAPVPGLNLRGVRARCASVRAPTTVGQDVNAAEAHLWRCS
jgi:hypothetical protein